MILRWAPKLADSVYLEISFVKYWYIQASCTSLEGSHHEPLGMPFRAFNVSSCFSHGMENVESGWKYFCCFHALGFMELSQLAFKIIEAEKKIEKAWHGPVQISFLKIRKCIICLELSWKSYGMFAVEVMESYRIINEGINKKPALTDPVEVWNAYHVNGSA